MDKNTNPAKRNSHYTGMGIALGPAFGFILGLLFEDNLALGISIGVAVGLIIGSIADAQAARKNQEE